MYFVGVAFKGGGGIFWFESFQTQAKIARLTKCAYPDFKAQKRRTSNIQLFTEIVKLMVIFFMNEYNYIQTDERCLIGDS